PTEGKISGWRGISWNGAPMAEIGVCRDQRLAAAVFLGIYFHCRAMSDTVQSRRLRIVTLSILMAMFTIVSKGADEGSDAAMLLETHCVRCHGGEKIKGG